VGGQRHAPASLPPGKIRGTHCGWSPGPVWTGAENLVPTGIRSPDRPARSESLCRLIYLCPYFGEVPSITIVMLLYLIEHNTLQTHGEGCRYSLCILSVSNRWQYGQFKSRNRTVLYLQRADRGTTRISFVPLPPDNDTTSDWTFSNALLANWKPRIKEAMLCIHCAHNWGHRHKGGSFIPSFVPSFVVLPTHYFKLTFPFTKTNSKFAAPTNVHDTSQETQQDWDTDISHVKSDGVAGESAKVP